jgi:hypothetical protein
MRGRVDPVYEPGAGTDRGGHAEREILAESERLEVINDERLVEGRAQL